MFPKLIRMAKTPVRVVVTDELNEFGEKSTPLDKSFMCNYQDAASIRYSADRQAPEVTGMVLIDGDILPTKAVIDSGYVVIFGEKRPIHRGVKCRNFDGSVNYTRLEVI